MNLPRALVGRLRRNLNRKAIILAGISALSSFSASNGFAQADDKAIKGVSVGLPATLPNNFGDTWIAAWADDDNLYTPSNDTSGFREPDLRAALTPEQRKKLAGAHPAAEPENQTENAFSTLAFNRLS